MLFFNSITSCRNAAAGWKASFLKSLLAILISCQTIPLFAQPDYKDVAPIFYSRCTSCHHPGGAGPFPFMQYSETAAMATFIYTALTDGIMPPWSPDTTYSRFLHERIITQPEKNLILDWIAANTPQGDTTLAPPPPVYGQYQLYGTPTMELQIPTFASNAVGQDSYVCFSLPTNLTQDRYLRAFEIVPGNPAIVHHVIVNADTLGTSVTDTSGACFTAPGHIGIGGFAPGAPPTVLPGQFPMKLGIRIPAGSKIILQLHYPAGSVGIVDSTKIRLYFYPVNEPGIRPVGVTTLLQNWALFIPANDSATFHASYSPVPIPISVLAVFPHSHLLCRRIINYAHFLADTIPLIRINEWDFEWQGYYSYRYPVKVPAGYALHATHFYDNTSGNPNNPNNPPLPVFAGLSTTDEMLFDGMQFTYYLPGDELIDIASILATDSLLSGLPDEPAPEIKMITFPNPATSHVTFIAHGVNDEHAVVDVFNLVGKLVASISMNKRQDGIAVADWEFPGTISAGIYVYKIRTSESSGSGRLVIMHDKLNDK